jgi:hypothetical protein
MHMLVGIVLHITVLAIIGYLLLWTASKAEGLVALIGWVLGLWVFILAIVSVAAIVVMPKGGDRPYGIGMMHDHGMSWMHRWDGAPDQKVTPEPAAPATATPLGIPAKPAPVKKP